MSSYLVRQFPSMCCVNTASYIVEKRKIEDQIVKARPCRKQQHVLFAIIFIKTHKLYSRICSKNFRQKQHNFSMILRKNELCQKHKMLPLISQSVESLMLIISYGIRFVYLTLVETRHGKDELVGVDGLYNAPKEAIQLLYVVNFTRLLKRPP